jgi:hypothetical protein
MIKARLVRPPQDGRLQDLQGQEASRATCNELREELARGLARVARAVADTPASAATQPVVGETR